MGNTMAGTCFPLLGRKLVLSLHVPPVWNSPLSEAKSKTSQHPQHLLPPLLKQHASTIDTSCVKLSSWESQRSWSRRVCNRGVLSYTVQLCSVATTAGVIALLPPMDCGPTSCHSLTLQLGCAPDNGTYQSVMHELHNIVQHRVLQTL